MKELMTMFWLPPIFSPLLTLLTLPGGYSARKRSPTQDSSDYPFQIERMRMVDEQLRARGISDPDVLNAMATVPRHRFVHPSKVAFAYRDRPLSIGYAQTISQPYIVAFMLEAARLHPDQTVLEIGTGSGYQTALLSELVSQVYTVEIIPALAKRSRKVFRELGYKNIHMQTGDGYQGWPQYAPYDAILVTAAPEYIPAPLLEQLAPDGRMVIPVGGRYQDLTVLHKTPQGSIQRKKILPVYFVPMTGQAEDAIWQ